MSWVPTSLVSLSRWWSIYSYIYLYLYLPIGSLVFDNKIYLKKLNLKVLLFGSFLSPRLLISNWSTIEKTTILAFPFLSCVFDKFKFKFSLCVLFQHAPTHLSEVKMIRLHSSTMMDWAPTLNLCCYRFRTHLMHSRLGWFGRSQLSMSSWFYKIACHHVRSK